MGTFATRLTTISLMLLMSIAVGCGVATRDAAGDQSQTSVPSWYRDTVLTVSDAYRQPQTSQGETRAEVAARPSSYIVVAGRYTTRSHATATLKTLGLQVDAGFVVTTVNTRRGTIYQLVSAPQDLSRLNALLAELHDRGIAHVYLAQRDKPGT